ncbi:MAG: hypothetical protein HY910_03660 [Desulfarculus sp.]|nr:hypothetical protein [Desulfarculus sp.]
MDYYRIICGQDGTVRSMSRFDHQPLPMPLAYITTDTAVYEAGLADLGRLRGVVEEGQVVGVQLDPAWEPPAPPADPFQELTEVVRRNLAASPHDKRFLTQKAIGKQAIAWIKEHPACTPQEAEDYVMGLVQAELAGEPMVPKLYWEYQGVPQGLAMSYLHEAIKRGYLPAGTPLTWVSLTGLIVATPQEQIAAWLRSL